MFLLFKHVIVTGYAEFEIADYKNYGWAILKNHKAEMLLNITIMILIVITTYLPLMILITGI